jgi:hypothetical protein
MKRMNQNTATTAMILTAGLFFTGVSVFGQPLQVSIKVNSTVGIQQVLPYETLPEKKSPSGTVDLTKKTRTVNAMGAFTIKGKENCNVLVQLNAPDMLTNKENQSMPFNMSLAWHNNTAGDPNKLTFSTNKTNMVAFGKGLNTADEKTNQDDERTAYLYLKGTVDVPLDSQSPPEGRILMTIEY